MKISMALVGAAITAVLQAAAQSNSIGVPSTAGNGKKPNLVLIMADDLGYGSLGCFGCPQVSTPNIDLLAASGVRLTDFHSNGALCTPTRAALMTGRYPQRCAWVEDAELSLVYQEQRRRNPSQRWAWGISRNEVTLPALLRKAGYHTALAGKWHLGYDHRFHPMNYGFDEFRGFLGGNVDYHTHVAGYGRKELDWWLDKKIKNEDGYVTDLLTEFAEAFIGRHKDRPFFLYLAHAAPHEPWQGRDAVANQSPLETYREMVGILDESVGEVIRALREHQLENDTLVVFCSDNGPAPPRSFAANGLLQGKKGSMFEGGHRVPFIASWPGVIPAGSTCSGTVMSMDLLPTFARLAGAEARPDHVIDGIDILPMLKGASQDVSRVIHWRSGDQWAVRKGSWKLIGNGRNPVTLVNLTTDIGEKEDRMKERPELVEELTRLHLQWVASVGER